MNTYKLNLERVGRKRPTVPFWKVGTQTGVGDGGGSRGGSNGPVLARGGPGRPSRHSRSVECTRWPGSRRSASPLPAPARGGAGRNGRRPCTSATAPSPGPASPLLLLASQPEHRYRQSIPSPGLACWHFFARGARRRHGRHGPARRHHPWAAPGRGGERRPLRTHSQSVSLSGSVTVSQPTVSDSGRRRPARRRPRAQLARPARPRWARTWSGSGGP